ncbi:hypothetical protein BJY52DRAFT_1185350 [Lactarius psammicola]|nr:hypothetical protein BJY52DRAFT_1185350 [Lactarius psammicola]
MAAVSHRNIMNLSYVRWQPSLYSCFGFTHRVSLNSIDTTASFSDLTSVLTFDFRGGKLSSLCALSESISVTTLTSAEPPTGTLLTFDNAGCLTCHRWNIVRQRGNTVAIMVLFALLPVRLKELERHAKLEFRKELHLLWLAPSFHVPVKTAPSF